MKKPYLIPLLVMVLAFAFGSASAEEITRAKVESYVQRFTSFDVTNSAKIWSETRAFDGEQRAPYTFSLDNGALKVDVDKNFTPTSGNNNFVSFRYNISVDTLTVADMSEYPFISFKVKASESIPMRIQIFEASEAFNVSGAMNQAAFNSEPVPADEWVTLNFDFSEKFKHVASGVTTYGDSSQIFQFLIVPGPGATSYGDFSKWVGTVYIDDIKIGKAAVVELGDNSALSSLTSSIGILTPEFSATTLAYTVELPVGTADVPTITAVAADEAASVIITNATSVTSTEVADRTTTITVLAEDGVSETIYTVVFDLLTSTASTRTSTFAVYPNPAINVLHFTETAISYRVYSATGALLNSGSNAKSVDLSGYKPGLYILRATTIEGESTHKFMKK